MKTRRGGYTTPNLTPVELEEEAYSLLGRINFSVPRVLYREILSFLSAKAQEVQNTDQTHSLRESDLPEVIGESRSQLHRLVEILKTLGEENVGLLGAYLNGTLLNLNQEGGRRRKMRKTRRRKSTRRRM